MSVVHVTSDEKSAQAVRHIMEGGQATAWQEALYEGPLVARWKDFPKTRAVYFSRAGLGSEKNWLTQMRDRQDLMQRALKKAKRVIAWFGPSFSEQLQFCSFVDWLEQQKSPPTIALVPFPKGRGLSFSGFNATVLHALSRSAPDLSAGQIESVRATWRNIVDQNPTMMQTQIETNSADMPELNAMLQRWMQEFPARRNGLSRTQRTILDIVAGGSRRVNEVHRVLTVRENGLQIPYSLFVMQIRRLLECDKPAIYIQHRYKLVASIDQNEDLERHEIGLTSLGWDLLKNKADWVQTNGIDRWLGGVHLRDDNIWRWDAERNALAKTYV